MVGVPGPYSAATRDRRHFHGRGALWSRCAPPTAPSSRERHGPQPARPAAPSPRWTCARRPSSHATREPPPPRATLDDQVRELEHESQTRRLTKHDFQTRLWPLLEECAAVSSLAYNKRARRNTGRSTQQELLDRAKLTNRLLELCLREVEVRRVFLWEWLQNLEHERDNHKSEDATASNFSPTAYWNDVPHPTSAMYSLVILTWKAVIESCTSFSVHSVDVLDLMESSAQQASSVLFLMEEERAADVGFAATFNATAVGAGRTAPLAAGAAAPDLRNYSDAIHAWGQCIDGSAGRLLERRGGEGRGPHRGGAFERRLRLEASAMKAMMKLLESMEAGRYEALRIRDEDTVEDARTTPRRPAPDRICYNIVLAAMARQVTPSLYEMRLVLQRMMERVQAEMEHVNNDTELDQEEYDARWEAAKAFFPDVYSYNAHIEALANRAATFAARSDGAREPPHGRFAAPRRHVWEGDGGAPPRNRSFASCEEEAILAEHTLEEMRGIVTVSVRPDIWSYNSVIKAWLKTDTERGLQRAVMLLRALAVNGQNGGEPRAAQQDDDASAASAKGGASTVLGRLSRWGAALFGEGNAAGSDDDMRGKTASFAEVPGDAGSERTNGSSNPSPHAFEHIHYTIQESNRSHPRSRWTGPQTNQQHPPPMMRHAAVGMASRMALINSACQGGQGHRISPNTDGKRHRMEHKDNRWSEPLGQQPQTKGLVGHVSAGMASRMALISSACHAGQEKHPIPSVTDRQSHRTENKYLEQAPIGPLPTIEGDVSPDLKTFTIVINALVRRGTAQSANLAEELLHLIEEYHVDLHPNITLYNTALNGWAQAAKEAAEVPSAFAAAQKADQLLHQLLGKDREDLGLFPPPDEYSFLMAMNAYAYVAAAAVSAGNSPHGPMAAKCLDDLLTTLQQQPLGTNATTVACYGVAIRTWASLGNAFRAHAVLEDMIQASGHVRLDLIHFNAVLDAAARELESERDPEKVIAKLSSVRDLLRTMESRGCNVDPDTSTYNTVIRASYAPWKAAAQTRDDRGTSRAQQKALEIAYESYSRTGQRDAHTYAHMFKAIACLPSSSSDAEPDALAAKLDLCTTILRDCCRDGHLAKSSVWILRKMFGREEDFAALLLSQMHQQHGMTKEKLLCVPEDQLHACLPAEWSRNGREFKALNRHRQ